MNFLPKLSWVSRRYRVPDFKQAELDAELKKWVRFHGCSIYGMPKVDLIKRYFHTGYSIAKSKLSLLTQMTVPLYVSYRVPILYVFSSPNLPSELSDIYKDVFAAYAERHGGNWIEETPLAFSSSILMTSPLSYFEALNIDYSLRVRVEPELERVDAATEEIHVPLGVSVNVKRCRTIKHSVEIVDSEKTGGKLEFGLKIASLDVVRGTISNEIEKQIGKRFEETETIEYDVTLSGDRSQSYKLIWSDLMRRGIVEIHKDGVATPVPFRCRERTELDVIPI